ncbi:N2,N2-dimethylguanosine tRNA methyltransferase [Kwoniella heveanensis BCC8398]|uniref:tRNA (guanine(26)-N(2))-dimethyltransferase n=1 Tax=Kwoniella heveanensis BCC8398 TaxID=1296120 RepID=A0A1B9H0B6_9TREE|nr:N2,N2-dimethylguanosine tRNA methyltransferase [Kwoniella heveanensis BCC8398]
MSAAALPLAEAAASSVAPATAAAPSASASSSSSDIPYTVPLPGGMPKDHTTHTESTTTIFLPKAGAFLNPVQHYNRDMSVAVIRAWNELRKEELEEKWRIKLEKRGGKPKPKKKKGKGPKTQQAESGSGGAAEADAEAAADEALAAETDVPVTTEPESKPEEDALNGSGVEASAENPEQPVAGPSKERTFRAPSINILEALAATGLRSIRYAKEIPNVKYVFANDLSPSACEAMKRNVEFNGVGEVPPGLPSSASKTVAEAVNTGAPLASTSTDEAVPIAIDGAETEKPKGAESVLDTTSSNAGSKSASDKAKKGTDGEAEVHEEPKDAVGRRPGCKGRVKINEGDACAFMYSHRSAVGPTQRVDVVDLDPYGTAAPFIDAALGCIADGGLLAITCTDLAVLAGQQYPEKCYSNYGGTNVHAEYTHEAALRLVMHSLATCAARYGRYITPLLSFSIDFYVRLFIRVDTRPEQVKRLASQTGVVFTCNYCQSPVIQPFGKIIEKETAKGARMTAFKTVAGPTATNGSHCDECGSTMHLGGPLWIGPLQDPAFAKRVIADVTAQEKEYKTCSRMLGMLTLAAQELPDPFFFTANRVAKSVHAPSMPMNKVLSALLNAGYKVSRSHALAGAVKTNAPRSFIYDILREDIKTNPVRLDKIPEGSPARVLLAKPMTHTIDFTPHPDVALERTGKETFYQLNPLPNWGPAPRAKSIQVTITTTTPEGKRKIEEVEVDADGVVENADGELTLKDGVAHAEGEKVEVVKRVKRDPEQVGGEEEEGMNV